MLIVILFVKQQLSLFILPSELCLGFWNDCDKALNSILKRIICENMLSVPRMFVGMMCQEWILGLRHLQKIWYRTVYISAYFNIRRCKVIPAYHREWKVILRKEVGLLLLISGIFSWLTHWKCLSPSCILPLPFPGLLSHCTDPIPLVFWLWFLLDLLLLLIMYSHD